MNHKAVCRTAPATPGLLKTLHQDTISIPWTSGKYKVKNVENSSYYQAGEVTDMIQSIYS